MNFSHGSKQTNLGNDLNSEPAIGYLAESSLQSPGTRRNSPTGHSRARLAIMFSNLPLVLSLSRRATKNNKGARRPSRDQLRPIGYAWPDYLLSAPNSHRHKRNFDVASNLFWAPKNRSQEIENLFISHASFLDHARDRISHGGRIDRVVVHAGYAEISASSPGLEQLWHSGLIT